VVEQSTREGTFVMDRPTALLSGSLIVAVVSAFRVLWET
jgi:hypothetical protein